MLELPPVRMGGARGIISRAPCERCKALTRRDPLPMRETAQSLFWSPTPPPLKLASHKLPWGKPKNMFFSGLQVEVLGIRVGLRAGIRQVAIQVEAFRHVHRLLWP